jgi:hypothetical protein
MKHIKLFEDFINESKSFNEAYTPGDRVLTPAEVKKWIKPEFQQDVLSLLPKMKAIFTRKNSVRAKMLDLIEKDREKYQPEIEKLDRELDDLNAKQTDIYSALGQKTGTIRNGQYFFYSHHKDRKNEQFIGNEVLESRTIDGDFLANILAGFTTGELKTNLSNLENYNDDYDYFPDWAEDGDDDIVSWAKKKFKEAGIDFNQLTKSYKSIWFEDYSKEKAEKELAKLKSEGFSYYGIYDDPQASYKGMEVVVVAKKPLNTKNLSISKPLDKMLDDTRLTSLWGIE